MPKIFSFFLVPLYTAHLTTDEYGLSDIILTTSSLLAPFISLSLPSAVLRFTIEDKSNGSTIWVALRVYIIGMSVLGIGLCLFSLVFNVKWVYLAFIFIITGSSVLADINLSFSRGLERMNLVTLCGVGSSLVSITSNVLFIVVLRLGIYGFLISSATGYFFNIILTAIWNRDIIFKSYEMSPSIALRKEMLQFSIPTIFTGLSWWVISSSDRYFVSGLCGAGENGIYSVAYKIPTILQAIDNVFYQAWIYTLYESYKTEDGREYIVRVYDTYNFMFCLVGSILITITIPLSRLLYAKEFYNAWRYVPLLIVAIVMSSGGGLTGNFLSLYKKTQKSMMISFVAAGTNISLNYLLIQLIGNAVGAAIATAFTFMVSWALYTYYGMKYSGIKVRWRKAFFLYVILLIQAIMIVKTQNMFISAGGILIITVMNINSIIWAKDKWRTLLKR